jgi:hypothetical protein
MMLADSLPDPNSYTAIGWWCVIGAVVVGALLLGANQLWDMVDRARGKAPHPPNSQLESDARDIKRRVKILEEWRDTLMDKIGEKLEADKQEILTAGEKREEKLSEDIKDVREDLKDKHAVNEKRINRANWMLARLCERNRIPVPEEDATL